jgi:hypothetical protein
VDVHQHVVVVEIAVLVGAQVLEAEGVLAEDADMLVASVAADGGAFFPPGTLTPTFVELNLAPAAPLPNGMLTFSYNSRYSAMRPRP